VSRGGRRRKGKRGRSGPGAERRSSAGEKESEERADSPPGRRRGSGRSGAGREVSVIDQMNSLPVRLQTLPPDGTVLEELIGALQSEYGVPATPQEYRLIIKTPAPEENTDPSIEVKPAAPPAEFEDEAGSAKARTTRRRRRTRRRGLPGAVEAESDDADLAAGYERGLPDAVEEPGGPPVEVIDER